MTSTRFITLLLATGLAAAGCGGSGGEGGAGIATAGSQVVPEGDPIAGRDAFILGASPTCDTCHTLADADATGTVGPNLDQLQPSFDQVIEALNTGPGEMPSYADTGQTFKENVAAYVSTVAGQG